MQGRVCLDKCDPSHFANTAQHTSPTRPSTLHQHDPSRKHDPTHFANTAQHKSPTRPITQTRPSTLHQHGPAHFTNTTHHANTAQHTSPTRPNASHQQDPSHQHDLAHFANMAQHTSPTRPIDRNTNKNRSNRLFSSRPFKRNKSYSFFCSAANPPKCVKSAQIRQILSNPQIREIR